MEDRYDEHQGELVRQRADFPAPTLRASGGIPIDRPDGNFAFANTTQTVATPATGKRGRGRPRVALTVEEAEEKRARDAAKKAEKSAAKKAAKSQNVKSSNSTIASI